ncbi:MAG: recombination-associated protein RdgC [Proteobacteria bacterium]|nr:recombination-associated protein RdgC [Pseudomonadota bacterium]MCP4917032.1 recombination-associated protein RdgC [Pseudomonadota bacterium]
MGILKGAMTARRYTVMGEVPDGFRVTFVDMLNAYGFREPASRTSTEEHYGWVLTQNLLDHDFEDLNAWLFGHYAVFQLRVDKKVLPKPYFNAHLQKRIEAWCEENGVKQAPRNVKTELKEQLEFEWLANALPRVKVTEVCWNVAENWVLFGSLSERENDRFRKLFHQTFGIQLVATNPLDLLGDETLAHGLEQTGGSELRIGPERRIVDTDRFGEDDEDEEVGFG